MLPGSDEGRSILAYKIPLFQRGGACAGVSRNPRPVADSCGRDVRDPSDARRVTSQRAANATTTLKSSSRRGFMRTRRPRPHSTNLESRKWKAIPRGLGSEIPGNPGRVGICNGENAAERSRRFLPYINKGEWRPSGTKKKRKKGKFS